MFEVIYRLLEMLALVLCLHSLSGEKVKLDIYNVGFIVIELTFMQMIRDEIVSKQLYFAVYLIYFVYAYVKFKDTIQRTILKCMLVIIINVCLQMIIYIPMSFINYIIPSESVIIVCINAVMLIILFLTRNNSKYTNVVELCAKKDWVSRMCLLLCIAIMVYCMFSIKISSVIEIDTFILISLFMSMFMIFLYRWQEFTYEMERKDREIKMTNLYNGVFEEMIETIRRRQHDFHNQIDAVYSLHLTSDSLEELVDAQREYCDNLIYENRYTKVLGCIHNSILSGFIYSKFTKAEQRGIEIEFNVSFTENTKISIHDLIEIIGIFIDNSIEAVAGSELIKKIVFELNDYKGLNLCVKNAVADISNKDIEKFFEKGYTTKESGRGIGLSKIKEYQKKYNYSIYARLVKQKEIEWLELKIIENM